MVAAASFREILRCFILALSQCGKKHVSWCVTCHNVFLEILKMLDVQS